MKAESNRGKHGVTFEEASTVFADPLGSYAEDALHEDRMMLVGESAQGRLLCVVFVDQTLIRIISARRATPYERKRYEERH